MHDLCFFFILYPFYPCVFVRLNIILSIYVLLCIFLMICALFREYVALLQKKDPKLYSLSQNFCKQQHQQDEHQNLRPIPVTKFRRWNCSSCLDKVNSADRTTSITLSPKQNATDNSGCSISFVRSVLPTSVHHTRLPTCTQRSSQGNEVVGSAFPKSTQECNSKCNSPSGSKGLLIEMNVDPATKGIVELDESFSNFSLYTTANTLVYSQSHRSRPIIFR